MTRHEQLRDRVFRLCAADGTQGGESGVRAVAEHGSAPLAGTFPDAPGSLAAAFGTPAPAGLSFPEVHCNCTGAIARGDCPAAPGLVPAFAERIEEKKDGARRV